LRFEPAFTDDVYWDILRLHGETVGLDEGVFLKNEVFLLMLEY
jgi:hypothetical protein